MKQISAKSKGHTGRFLLLAGIVLFTAFVMYEPVSSFEFINYDDDNYVLNNPDIKELSLSGVKKIFLNPYNPEELMPPLSVLTLAVNYHFSGYEAGPYHFTNIILHLLNCLLVFLLAYKVGNSVYAGFFVSAIFALSPFNAESVAWISARKEVLYTFFYLSALLLCIKFWSSRNWIFYSLAVLLFFLSFFSKFSAATFPVLYILLALIWKSRKDHLKVLAESIPFLILPAYSLVLAFTRFDINQLLQPGESIHQPVMVYDSFSYLQKLFLGGYSFLAYLVKYFLPFNQQLIYPYPDLTSTGSLPEIYHLATLASILVVAVSVYLIFRYRKNLNFRHPATFGVIFFLVHIGILIHLLPIGGRVIIADRYTYLPYIGLSIILFFILKTAKDNFSGNYKYAVLAAGAFFLLLNAYQLQKRIPDWQNSEAIFTDMMEKEPDYAIPYNNLGAYYENKGHTAKATSFYTKAISLAPFESALFYNNRGFSYYRQQEFTKAIHDYRKALSLDSSYSQVKLNMASAFMQMNQLDSAEKYYLNMTKTDPLFSKSAWYNAGIIYMQKNDFYAAEYYLQKCIEMAPEFEMAYYSLGVVYKNGLNNFDKAIKTFEQSLALEPNNVNARLMIAETHLQSNNLENAIIEYSQILAAPPGQARAYVGRGKAYLLMNNLSGACSDFQSALNAGHPESRQLIQQYCEKNITP